MKYIKILASVFILTLFLFTAAVPVLAALIPEDAVKTINIFTEDGRQGKSIDSCSFGDPVWEFPSVCQGMTIYGIKELGPNQTTVEVIIPEGVEFLDGSFSEFSALEKALLPSTLLRIYDYSFYQCGALSEISLPDGLLSIGDRAFSQCTSLQSITIPDSVTEIGHNAFSGCTSLKEVKIGSGIRNTGSYTFRDCDNLESVIFSDGLEIVGYEAFFNTSVKALTLPKSIKQLGVRAFNLEKLEKIVYEGTKTEFEAIVNDAFEEYNDKIIVECTDGTITYNDSANETSSGEATNTSSDISSKDVSENPGKENGSPDSLSGIIAAIVVAFVAICGVAVFLLIKSRKKADQ